MRAAVPPDAALARLAERLSDRNGGAGLLIVVAHPDDETIGLGGQLARLPRSRLVHVTDGAPRNLEDAQAKGFVAARDYAEARAAELDAALGEAGFPTTRRVALAIPDQEAIRALPEIARRLAQILAEEPAELVLTHAFEGGHPDHDAVAFAVAAAVRLRAAEKAPAPAVIEMPFYHLGPSGQVAQRFAPGATGPVLELALTAADWARKGRMFARFTSQRDTLAVFDSRIERFRAAPPRDFALLPNGGRILYEAWNWGIAGPDVAAAMAAAERELGLAP